MKMNKVIKLSAGALLCGLVLAGCGDKGATEANTKTEDGKTPISWMAILHNPTPPSDVITDKLEEYTNTDLTFNWMPASNYEERLTTSLASGELTDIVTVSKMGNSTVKSSIKNGVFWDVTPYLKDYKNLADISDSLLDTVRVDGKIYGVPIQKALSRCGWAIRKDWLDNLGLEEPKTTDDLFAIAKAFTEDDPDGNGKDDTIGIYDRGFTDINYTSFKEYVMYFGGVTGWGMDEDGNFFHQTESPAWKDAMNFYKKMYDAGYSNQDFAIAQKKDQNEKLSQGKYGMYPGAGMTAIAGFEETAKNMGDDKMDLIPVNKISSDGTENYHVWTEGNGLGGLLAFPKSEVKDEARLKEVLAFVDKLMDEDPYMLMSYGIEGVHYEMNDKDELVQTDLDKFGTDVQAFGSSRPDVVKYEVKTTNPKTTLANELVKENEKWAVLDPTIGLESDTYNQVGSEINKLVIDATVQYIMGQIDENGFDDAVKEWNKQGGEKIKEEYKASFEKNRK